MQETARRLRADESLLAVEPQVAPLHEVFRLQGDAELEEAERRYLPARESLSAVVLAAGDGSGFGGLTARTPKAMLKVQGRPILARLLDDFAALGGRDALVVRGYRAEAVDVPGARFVDNPDYASTGEAYSLSLAEAALGPGTLVAFGDIVLRAPHRPGAARGGGHRHHPRRRQRARGRRRGRPRPGRPRGQRALQLRGGPAPRGRRRRSRPGGATASGSGSSIWAATAPGGWLRRSARRGPTARSARRA